MRPLMLTFRFGIAALLLLSQNAASAPRIGILDFQDFSEYKTDTNLSREAANLLAQELRQSTPLNVLSPENIDGALKSLDGLQDNPSDKHTLLAQAKSIGLSYLVVGTINKFTGTNLDDDVEGIFIRHQFRTTTSIEVFKVNNGELVYSDSAKGKEHIGNLRIKEIQLEKPRRKSAEIKTIEETVLKFAKGIQNLHLEKRLAIENTPGVFSNRPLVADISGEKITLSKGKNAGIKYGQTYDVLRLEKTVKDPKTGRTLKKAHNTIGRIKIVYLTNTHAEAILLAGNEIRQGDEIKVSE